MMLSLEYIMLFLISMSLLAMSVFALGSIQDFAEYQFDAYEFRQSVNSLDNAMKEICALGSGNSRMVLLTHGISVEDGDVLSYTSGDHVMTKRSACPVENAVVDGPVKVENREGMIRIRQQ